MRRGVKRRGITRWTFPSGTPRRRRSEPVWATWTDEQLLDLPMNRLGLKIEGTILEDRLAQLHDEFEARGIRFRPHYWLSEEWFTPDGVPGIAIPFYLAHPRLIQLERRRMLNAEGASREECMRILRHEAGHAIDNAYRLRLRRLRQSLFGAYSKPYPTSYRPRPGSKRYVQHLNHWYAQSHPAEDFAETFAVWLKPGTDWRRRYAGWPAMKKLDYMDQLMRELAGKAAPVQSRGRVDPLSSLKKTLREYYEEKRRAYAVHYPDFYDADLRRLFPDAAAHCNRESASAYLRRARGEIRAMVARWTGEQSYALDQVLNEMIGRCAELKLRRTRSARRTKQDFALLLAVQTAKALGSNERLRIAM